MISDGTMPAGSGSWWTRREKIMVKNASAIIVPTAIANRLTSCAHAIGMVPPATAMSSVATPGISHAGTTCVGSPLPRKRRPAMTKVSAMVSTVPSVQTAWPSASWCTPTTDDSSRMAMVMVPKKFPATGWLNSARTASR
ncbi:hypothetical protein D3C72_1671640 [compost metagenome]